MKKCVFFIIVLFCIGLVSKAQSSEAWKLCEDGFDYLDKGDNQKAFVCFKKAADMGSSWGMCELGTCYCFGESVPVDFEKAFEYYYKAATNETPYPYAFCALGDCYHDGTGVHQNYEEAVRWWKKGIEMFPDNPMIAGCMNALGRAYFQGEGVPQNNQQGEYWYRKAIGLGCYLSAQNLGKRYLTGKGVKEDEEEGLKLIKWAAESDDPHCAQSQCDLGICYAAGLCGLPQDKEKALYWFKKSAAKGYTRALIHICNLESKE